MKYDQVMSYYKRKDFNKKFYYNYKLKTSCRPFCVYKELSANAIKKWILKQATYISHSILAKLTKLIQLTMQATSDSFLQNRAISRANFIPVDQYGRQKNVPP